MGRLSTFVGGRSFAFFAPVAFSLVFAFTVPHLVPSFAPRSASPPVQAMASARSDAGRVASEGQVERAAAAPPQPLRPEGRLSAPPAPVEPPPRDSQLPELEPPPERAPEPESEETPPPAPAPTSKGPVAPPPPEPETDQTPPAPTATAQDAEPLPGTLSDE
jgi:hypothetical protein